VDSFTVTIRKSLLKILYNFSVIIYTISRYGRQTDLGYGPVTAAVKKDCTAEIK